MTKKITCMIISVLMILSLFTFSVSAENELFFVLENSETSDESRIPVDVALLEILTCTEGYTSLSVGTHEYSQTFVESIELKPNVGYHIYGVEINGVFQSVEGNIVKVSVELGKKVSLRPVFRGNLVFNVEQSAGGKLSPEGTVYVGTGKYFDVTATPDAGFVCTGIYINDVGLDIKKEGSVYKGSFKAPKEKEYTVYATFEPVETHTVTLTKNEGGKVIPFDENGKAYVLSGETAQFQAIPDEGYGIKSILANGKSVQWSADGVFSVENVKSDFEVSIEFIQMESIPVSINIKGKGKLTEAEKAYVNTKLILDVVAESGYELVSLKVNDSYVSLNKNGKLEINIDDAIVASGSVKIDAVFDVVAEKYIIRTVVQNSIGGAITAEGYVIENMRTEVRKGGSITLKFTPDMNYIIDKVKVDGVEVQLTAQNTFTLNNVTDNHGIIAYFIPDLNGEEEYFEISVKSSSGGVVSPSANQIVKQGQSITFDFAPENGFKVDYILVNGEKKEIFENSYTFDNVVSNQILEVFFVHDYGLNGEEVVIDITSSSVVDKDYFEQIKNDYKDKVVVLKGNNFSWKFPANYEYPSFDFNFSVEAGKENFPKEIIDALEKKMMESKLQGFDFETIKTNGMKLEYGAMLTLPLGSDYSGKMLDYLYYDESTGKFASVIETINSEYDEPKFASKQIVADSEGNVQLPYNGDKYLILVIASNSKYKLNIIAGENGSVSPRGTSIVSINTNQVIQITPDPGYMVGNILVNGTSMYEEYIGKTSSFAITLGKINNDYTVEVSFVPCGENNSEDDVSLDVVEKGGLKPWVVAIIIISIAIAGGVVLFIYKWNEEKDIVD